MTFSLSLDLLLYGLLLGGLSVVAHRAAPDFSSVTLATGLVGGTLTVLWGVLGLRGRVRRVWPMATLGIVGALLLVQAVKAWLALNAGVEGMKPVAVLLTLLVLFAAGQLMNLAQSGRHLRIKFEGETDKPATEKSQGPARPEPALDE